jgi:hypothetical protein
VEQQQTPSRAQPGRPGSAPSDPIWKLPPLILHPFAGEKGPDRLLEGSQAQLALHGLLPDPLGSREEMTRLVTAGKYQELKMLIYIGRDLQRWADQCLDFVQREPRLSELGLKEQSFLVMLVNRPPASFEAKLKGWGVTDQRSIFSRAIGLNSVFEQPPPLESLGTKFLQSYQRFADYFFICYQTMAQYRSVDSDRFSFDLYASEEYASLISEGWNT